MSGLVKVIPKQNGKNPDILYMNYFLFKSLMPRLQILIQACEHLIKHMVLEG
jgi:hypothetical protein